MHPTLHSLHVNHISVQKYTPNNTHPILRIREMYTDIYAQSYASHSTYQDTYTDIYKWLYASHYTYQNIVYHANANANAKENSCDNPLNCPEDQVKPYGMVALQASTSPRLYHENQRMHDLSIAWLQQSAKLSCRLVKPYGVTSQWASQPPRLLNMHTWMIRMQLMVWPHNMLLHHHPIQSHAKPWYMLCNNQPKECHALVVHIRPNVHIKMMIWLNAKTK